MTEIIMQRPAFSKPGTLVLVLLLLLSVPVSLAGQPHVPGGLGTPKQHNRQGLGQDLESQFLMAEASVILRVVHPGSRFDHGECHPTSKEWYMMTLYSKKGHKLVVSFHKGRDGFDDTIVNADDKHFPFLWSRVGKDLLLELIDIYIRRHSPGVATGGARATIKWLQTQDSRTILFYYLNMKYKGYLRKHAGPAYRFGLIGNAAYPV